MHELAIAEGIVQAVEERLPGARILRVVVRVGALTCVEPGAIRFCFEACAAGTALDGAALEVVEVAARGRCRACGSGVGELDPRLPLCSCGSADLELTEGQELTVARVEVA